MFRIEEFLFIEYDFVDNFGNALEPYIQGIIAAFFVIAIIYEMFSNGDIRGLVQRVFIAIITILFFSNLHKTLVSSSFDMANHVVDSLKESKVILDGLGSAIDTVMDAQETRHATPWEFIRYHLIPLEKTYNVIAATIIIFIAKLCLFVSKATYTIVYNLNLGLVAIPAAFSILPPFKMSLGGAFKTTAWCMVMPFVVLFMVFILSHQIMEHSSTGQIIGQNIEGTAIILTFAIFLAFCGLITWGILGGTGVMQAASIGGAYIGAQTQQLAKSGLLKAWRNKIPVMGQAMMVGGALKDFAKNNAARMVSPFLRKKI